MLICGMNTDIEHSKTRKMNMANIFQDVAVIIFIFVFVFLLKATTLYDTFSILLSKSIHYYDSRMPLSLYLKCTSVQNKIESFQPLLLFFCQNDFFLERNQHMFILGLVLLLSFHLNLYQI